MSRFLCVGSWAFGVVAFFGLVFFTVVFVFISTPELALDSLAPERRRMLAAIFDRVTASAEG
jgi:hypothetical protein